MAKHKYKARVRVADGVEETQFIPVAEEGAPRVKTIYQRDAKDHGKYKDGHEYTLDPEKAEEKAEAETPPASEDPAVEAMREQEKAAEKVAKKGKR